MPVKNHWKNKNKKQKSIIPRPFSLLKKKSEYFYHRFLSKTLTYTTNADILWNERKTYGWVTNSRRFIFPKWPIKIMYCINNSTLGSDKRLSIYGPAKCFILLDSKIWECKTWKRKLIHEYIWYNAEFDNMENNINHYYCFDPLSHFLQWICTSVLYINLLWRFLIVLFVANSIVLIQNECASKLLENTFC